MRKDDLVLTVLQNNAQRSLMVLDALTVPDWVSQYLDVNALKGANLDRVFVAEAMRAINAVVTFEEGHEDLSDALMKQGSVGLLGRHEEALTSQVRIAADIPKSDQPCFRLVINRPKELSARSDALLQRTKGMARKDDLTGLCTRATMLECADICQFYVDKGRFSAAVAYIGDKDEDIAAVQKMAANLQQTFRDSDVLCHVEKGVFCIMMPETSMELAKIPLTRLRASLENEVLIALTSVERGGDVAKHIEKLSAAVAVGEKLGDEVVLL